MNFLNKKTKKEGGFTIIESMIAISIVLVGVLSALILIIRSLALAPLIEDKLVASAVAQDCIERVIQVRNSNYIRSTFGNPILWDANFDSVKTCKEESASGGPSLVHKFTKFFNNNDGIELNYIPDTKQKKIECTVKWKTKGADYTLSVVDTLFDWGNLYDNP